jgi:surface antigen
MPGIVHVANVETYNDHAAPGQPGEPMIHRWIPLLVAASLAGCSVTPPGETPELDTTTTGSIAKPSPSIAATDPAPLGYAATPPAAAPRTAVDGVEPSDWERIRLVASTSIPGTANGTVLDWTNPDTGSNGTLSPLASARTIGERDCRGFALTVSDVRGIRRYRGDACRSPDGMWQLFDVTPEDRALL